jgi:hypothetical protein
LQRQQGGVEKTNARVVHPLKFATDQAEIIKCRDLRLLIVISCREKKTSTKEAVAHGNATAQRRSSSLADSDECRP